MPLQAIGICTPANQTICNISPLELKVWESDNYREENKQAQFKPVTEHLGWMCQMWRYALVETRMQSSDNIPRDFSEYPHTSSLK
jgi:hypothetical protein